jgi:hypothetical protein
MAGCELELEIDAPVALVWSLTQDAARRPEWDYRITRVELLSAAAPDKGVKLRSEGSFTGMGSFHTDLEHVVFEPGKRSAVKLLGGRGLPFVSGGGSWRYEQLAGDRCRFRTTLQMHTRRTWYSAAADRLLLEPFLRWMTRRSLRQLKRLAEAEARVRASAGE